MKRLVLGFALALSLAVGAGAADRTRVGAECNDGTQSSASSAQTSSLPRPDIVRIDSFLGISAAFEAYAIRQADGIKVLDLRTGKQLPSPTWDRDWGRPLSVTFGNDVIAVLTGHDVFGESLKIFSRHTGELEQNVRGQINGVAFTADERLVAITEFRPGTGYHLVLRDVREKKTVAELRLGSNGWSSLAVAGTYVAAYESSADQITVVDTVTGKLMRMGTGSLRQRKDRFFTAGPMPLAISPTGDLVAWEAEDVIVLFNLDSAKVVHRLEGHLDVVSAIAFSLSGRTVATSAKDKTIRLWDVKEGKEVSVIKNLPSSASALIFSSDGESIAVVYRDGREALAEIRSAQTR